jgi:hypothetical protein
VAALDVVVIDIVLLLFDVEEDFDEVELVLKVFEELVLEDELVIATVLPLILTVTTE